MTSLATPDAPLLRIGTLTKTFGGFTALDNISVDIKKGERFGLIGPNGSGKTTLINCISGALPAGRGPHPVSAARTSTRNCQPHHAHAARNRTQFPDPAAIQVHDGCSRTFMVALDFATASIMASALRPWRT